MIKHQPQHEIQAQLADLTETMEREKIKLSPEMSAYLKQSVETVQAKLMKEEPVYPKDMEFVEKIKKWILIQLLLPVIPILKTRFEINAYLHEGVEWSKVEESLKENPEALWSINEMEKAGHEPDVYNADEDGFDIGTCSKESPVSGRICMYDKEAAEIFRKKYPGAEFNSSAEEMADEMRIDMMSRDHYKYILQTKGEFDRESSSWLKTPADIRKSGDALVGFRNGGGIYVDQGIPDTHNDRRAWRGSLRVKWKK